MNRVTCHCTEDKPRGVHTSSAVIASARPHTLLSPSGLSRGSVVPFAGSGAGFAMDCRDKPGNDNGVWTGLVRQLDEICEYRRVKPRDDNGVIVRAAIQAPEPRQ